MADKEKKKLKVILKLSKPSQLKSPATAAEDSNSSALASSLARKPHFVRTSDQRDKNVQPRHLVPTTSTASLANVTIPSSSFVRSDASLFAPSAATASELRILSAPSSESLAPLKKRKFKSVEIAGASRLGGPELGASSAADGFGSGKDALKDGVKFPVVEETSAVVTGGGNGCGRGAGAGVATSGRALEASARKRSHRKAEISDRQRHGRPLHHFPGVDDHPRGSLASAAKPLFEGVLDKLQKKDTYGVFAEPVDAAQVPDYYDIIKDPMDFGTMRKKIKKDSYVTVELFEGDINLICNNAMRYNGPETIYFKQAKAIRDLARKALDGVRAQLSGDIRRPVLSKRRLPPSKKLHSKKPDAIKSRLDNTIHDLSSGAILGGDGGDREWSKSTVSVVSTEKKPFSAGCTGTNEFAARSSACTGVESKAVTLEDASGSTVKSMGPRDGRRPLSSEEYHRNTYIQRHLPAHGQGPPLAAVGGEHRQLIPVVNRDEHAYARSLSQFGALLGEKAWRIVARKLISIQAAPTTAVTASMISSISSTVGVEKDVLAWRLPIAPTGIVSPVAPRSAAKISGQDARHSCHFLSDKSVTTVNLASGPSHDMLGRAASTELLHVRPLVSSSSAVSTGIVDVLLGCSPIVSKASPQIGLLELSKRAKRPPESTSGSNIHSSGMKDCRGEDDVFASDEVESSRPSRNEVSDSKQQLAGLKRGFVCAAGRLYSLENDGDEQTCIKLAGGTLNSHVNPRGCDDGEALVKGGDMAVVGGTFVAVEKSHLSEGVLSDEYANRFKEVRTKPSTKKSQDIVGLRSVASSGELSTIECNLVTSGESSNVSRLGWETSSALYSSDSGFSGPISSTSFVKGHTPVWSTAALMHGALSSLRRDDRSTQSWGQPRGMTVTQSAGVHKSLSSGVQALHPQAFQSNVSANPTPSNVFAEHGNIASRIELQHGLSAPISGTSIAQNQDLLPADAFNVPLSLQKVSSTPDSNPRTRSTVQWPLQLQSMPPDLNVALLSPSALPSSPARERSNASSHQPDLKLQL